MAPIIHTVNLRKVYAVGKERVVALNDVSISIEKGEFCCIVGQSGSGKSTLLNQLAGLEKPTRGKVFIGSHEISAMTEDELAKFRQAHLGFIFQSYNLLPTMTAAENVALPLMFKGISRSQRLAMARKELKTMGLGGRAEHMPTEMSGGQQQRVGNARAVVPRVIFADEPTGNLDSITSKQVLYRMLQISKQMGTTFVMVTHEPELASCADRIITILDGKVQSDVVQDPTTRERNREALFASLEGNMRIGGASASGEALPAAKFTRKPQPSLPLTQPLLPQPSSPNNPNRKFCPLIQEYQSHRKRWNQFKEDPGVKKASRFAALLAAVMLFGSVAAMPALAEDATSTPVPTATAEPTVTPAPTDNGPSAPNNSGSGNLISDRDRCRRRRDHHH